MTTSPQTTTPQFSDTRATAWTTEQTPIPAQTLRMPEATQPAPVTGPPSPPSVVTPEPESRLDQLTAEFSSLKPQVDELTARLKTITDAIKQETWRAGATSEQTSEVVLRSPHLATAYRVHPVQSQRIDTQRLRRDVPAEVLAPYTKLVTSWRLDAIKAS